MANDGVVMKPHLVKEIENPITKAMRLTVREPSAKIDVKQSDIDVIKRAMEGVVTTGTGAKIFRGAPYQAAGKTGTAQVYSLQGANYSGHATAEHLRDHALFIAFAPAEHPTIAVALIVENGGWGAESAGPIARRVLDYYLIDRLKPGAEAAAVAAAASATEDANAPVIGAAQSPQDAALAASAAVPASAASSASVPAGAPAGASASTPAAGSSTSAAPMGFDTPTPPPPAVAPPPPPSTLQALEAIPKPIPPAPPKEPEAIVAVSGHKMPSAQKEPKEPKPPKAPPPPAIPRNTGKSAVQTVMPSGGIDE
jgi:penicillin-binding protein 2